jgi:uncharacterized protein YjbI with pentapeptide repeats
MANPEHLALIKQGVDTWNAWREQNRGVVPDLSVADLRCANLTGANFREANLPGAILDRADLRNADLSYSANFARANLREAALSGADLTQIHMVDADLGGADLTGAFLGFADLSNARMSNTDLSGADLREAELDDVILYQANLRDAYLARALLFRTTFSNSNLSGVDLEGALLRETVFANVDLAQVKNLGKCEHEGPSVIDHRTLQRSGQLPLSFLRGCGLPDNLIDYLPALFSQPIQFYSCFISYSSDDDEFARRLHADLQDKGIRCWFAPEDMKIGDRIRARIDEVIRLHEKLLLVLSANSIDSDWVEKEVETAFEKERETKSTVLFPVRLDEAVMESNTGWAADIKRTRHIGDFRGWKDHDAYSKAFERLLRDLRVETET